MQREAYYCAARSPNIVDVVVMRQGLHTEPEKLRGEVQKHLDVTNDNQGRPYDASLLGYGLCSNGIVGLHSKIPIVVPRGHDCITLLLGSKERYREYFESHKGTYWFSPGWIETDAQPGKERFPASPMGFAEASERTLKEYVEKFGEDNARYLVETERSWLKEYHWATYIDWGFANNEQEKQLTKKAAGHLGWKYDELKGESGLMQRLVDGEWNEKEFLVVKPGQTITENLTGSTMLTAGDEGIIKAQ
jgi:hypothetical protein